MKKYNVFKVLSIAILVTILLSFLIPSTSFDGYGSVTKGNINPVGFIDTFANSITSFSVFLNAFIFILCIGVFYGILHKTGKYDSVITNTAAKFEKNKTAFVIISILTFGIMSAIIGNMYAMLIFVPAFIGILRKLGYSKLSSISSTIGAIILGSAGSLFTNYSNQILGSTVTDNIFVKIIMIIISLVSLIVFTLVFTKKPENTKLEKKTVKNSTHISVIFDIVLVFIILGMIPWNSYFGFEGFSKFYETITKFEVFGVSPFKALITSTMAAFGEWTLFDLSVVILISSLVIALMNKIKLNNLFETLASSIKKTLPYALIVVIANVVLVNIYTSGLFYTIIVSAAKLKDKLFSGTLISALSAFVYPDYMYASQFSLSSFTAVVTDTKFLVLLAVIFQAVYSVFLLISPTSILVLLGLQYTGVSFKEWFKYICKYFLAVFGLLFITLMILCNKYMSVISVILLVFIVVLFVLLIVLSKRKNNNVKQVSKKEKVVELKEEEKKEEPKKEEVKVTKKTTTAKKTTKPATKKTTTAKKTNTKSKK